VDKFKQENAALMSLTVSIWFILYWYMAFIHLATA